MLPSQPANEILIPEYPCTAVSAARVRVYGGSTQTIDTSVSRIVGGRFLWLERDAFPCGEANIELDVTCGYVAGVHDSEISALRHLALRWLEMLWMDSKNPVGRYTAVAVPGASATVMDIDMPKDVARALQPFVRFP
jgi:hypothetical protein